MQETLSPYRGELQLISSNGEMVKIPDLNDLRNRIKRADKQALDGELPRRVAGLWVHRNSGSLRVLDEATRRLVMLDQYPYTPTGDSDPKLFPLPFFERDGYAGEFREHQTFFVELGLVLREHPGGWLSSPAGWSVRIPERSSARPVIEVYDDRLCLGFEKVTQVDFQPLLPGMIGV